MTLGKATALAAGLVGALALGVWAGPYLTGRADTMKNHPAVQVSPATLPHPEVPQTPAERRSRSSVAPNKPAARAETAIAAAKPTMIPVSTPQLHRRLKPLLRSGADMTRVAEGFQNAEDFAATVHASKNTNVPFMVLKHHVVDERKTLKSAIHDTKPAADASFEADLARSEARSDLASLN
jgi:hypothetical protein